MKKAIFLDRDGVLNQVNLINGRPFPPDSVKSLKLLPKVKEAIELFKQNQWFLVVVTNQPDVAREKTSKEVIEAINNSLIKTLGIDEFRVCFHDDSDNCHCRKPLPGLLMDAAKEHQIDLSLSYMIGDRWRDIEAGQAAGCQTIFLDYNYDEKKPKSFDLKVSSLYEAALIINGGNCEKIRRIKG